MPSSVCFTPSAVTKCQASLYFRYTKTKLEGKVSLSYSLTHVSVCLFLLLALFHFLPAGRSRTEQLSSHFIFAVEDEEEEKRHFIHWFIDSSSSGSRTRSRFLPFTAVWTLSSIFYFTSTFQYFFLFNNFLPSLLISSSIVPFFLSFLSVTSLPLLPLSS